VETRCSISAVSSHRMRARVLADFGKAYTQMTKNQCQHILTGTQAA
jgi:hypothetical protein